MPPINTDDILRVHKALQPLHERFAFLGGSVLGLLIQDNAAGTVRATKDVDVVIQVVTRAAFTRLEERLRQIGFRHDNQKTNDNHTETVTTAGRPWVFMSGSGAAKMLAFQ